MTCCHYYAITDDHESAFSVDIASISFGPGVLKEVGDHARALGMKRVAFFTDKRVGNLECVADSLSSLRTAGCDVSIYDEVSVEPTDASFRSAA
ncbi:MAG TPA: iron-containing alcohol dehydrogenase, partial [Burkholderiales bacterium]